MTKARGLIPGLIQRKVQAFYLGLLTSEIMTTKQQKGLLDNLHLRPFIALSKEYNIMT
jgi:hypothetical protein